MSENCVIFSFLLALMGKKFYTLINVSALGKGQNLHRG